MSQTTLSRQEPDPELAERVETINKQLGDAFEQMPWTFPVGFVRWVHVSRVQSNDYNPNNVAPQEMQLLYTSIAEDGYTQPVVALWDPDAGPDQNGRYVVVDGFHRYLVMCSFQDIYDQTGGFLPIVVLDTTPADRIASTVRHNRARGKHSVQGMGNLVFQMLEEGEEDSTICNKLGLEAQELVRLKHITGYSKLYASVETYSGCTDSSTQLREKAAYAKAHPDETVRKF